MRNNLFSAGQLSVSAVFPHIIPFTERAIEPYAETVTAFVVYSSIRTSYEDDTEFLLSHFLTTRSCYTIPRGKSHVKLRAKHLLLTLSKCDSCVCILGSADISGWYNHIQE